MNKFLLTLLLLSASTANAQSPPKKASKVIVIVKDTNNAMINNIARALFDRGFTIDTKDEQLKQLTTKERSNKSGTTWTKIRASVNDTAIVFTSQMALAMEFNIGGVTTKPTFDQVTYSGMKKSYMMEAWNELDAIAKQFGDKIVYLK